MKNEVTVISQVEEHPVPEQGSLWLRTRGTYGGEVYQLVRKDGMYHLSCLDDGTAWAPAKENKRDIFACEDMDSWEEVFEVTIKRTC